MSLFELEGTITAIGQSVFDNDIAVYAYLEIIDPAGGRTMVEKVAVCNDVGAVLAVGLSGQFFVDRMFRSSGALRCQLWGVRTERVAVLDRRNLRTQIGLLNILRGIATIPVLGLGFILIASGIRLLILSEQHDRNRCFYRGAIPPALPVDAVRI